MIEPWLTFEVRSAIITHMDEYPLHEVCGYIEKRKDDYVYVPSYNIHPDSGKTGPDGQRLDRFRFTDEATLRIRNKRSNVVAYVHSHPAGPAYPSVDDQKMQIGIKKPAVIASRDPVTGVLDMFSFGDHMLELPLYNRVFRHYVTDCFEAIRSYYHQERGVYLPPAPRENEWWQQGSSVNGMLNTEELSKNADLYIANFAKWGFEEYTPDFHDPTSPLHPSEGDVILMQLDAPVINHAAIYIGNNQIFHHRMNKKSGTNALGYLMDQEYVRKWVRYVGASGE